MTAPRRQFQGNVETVTGHFSLTFDLDRILQHMREVARHDAIVARQLQNGPDLHDIARSYVRRALARLQEKGCIEVRYRIDDDDG